VNQVARLGAGGLALSRIPAVAEVAAQ